MTFTDNEIVVMAKEACKTDVGFTTFTISTKHLQVFAEMVAAKAIAELESQEPLGYIASMALNDLRDGIYGEVRVYSEELGGSVPIYTTPPQRTEQEPVCPECKAEVLYECVACSRNNYPPQRTEQNFCSRCGKRTNDIHTCTPPQSTWVGLTDEEINDIVEDCDGVGWDVAQAIRAKLKEKNCL